LSGRDASALRQSDPKTARLVDDFYLMLCNPHAFDFARKPHSWQRAMMHLSSTYQRFQGQVQFDQRELLKSFLRSRL